MVKKIGDDPELRNIVLDAGRAKLASEQTGERCRHPVITDLKHWPGSEKLKTGSFDHGHCVACTTGVSVRPYVFKQFRSP